MRQMRQDDAAVPDMTTCDCGGILKITYDYDFIKTRLTKDTLASRRDRSMWRWRELLPVQDTTENTPLRVGDPPLYDVPRLADRLGLKRLYIKDDGQNPTSSLEDRTVATGVPRFIRV